ncbi:MAG: DNA adenine methylase [Thermosynechococcaceae cyanobacterium MS004]|nr:DNA adenine methylase [Thermosynechococcaceae cyanobacterium MS004]
MALSSSLPIPPRPFLKWAGGKSRLIVQYQPFLPQAFDTYYEPFLGGGALFFYLRPQRAVLSDINPELVNVYTCVRDRVEELIEQLTHHAAHHGQDYYYQMRAETPEPPVARAARLIYLNKTCFNGLYRVNAQGQFNVPMGRYSNPKICDRDLLQAASEALQSATIVQRSFHQILEANITPQDFVYFDPPYQPLSVTSNFTGYSRDAFTAAHQIQLRDIFAQLAQHQVQVLLSNSDCPFIRELYQDFPIQTIHAARAINVHAQKRGKINEVLVTAP